jgi:hypothetical protein
MTVQQSVAVRNAKLDAGEVAISTTPILKLFAGAQPANCAAATSSESESLLATGFAAIVAAGLVQEASDTLSATGYKWGFSAERAYTVAAESRAYSVAIEQRAYSVPLS